MRTLLSLALLSLPLLGQRDGAFDRTLTVSGAADLDIETHSGRIAVHAGNGSTVQIHGTIHLNSQAGADIERRIREIEANPPIQQTGNTIRVTRLADESLRRQLFISYEITTPTASKLRSVTGSGGVTVEGISGPVDVSSCSGSVSATRIGNEVRARTGSGRIELDTIQGRLNAETGSGSIRALAVTGPSVLRTGSGSLHLEQISAGPVQVQTGSGGVDLHLPSRSGFDLHARTGSGRVSVSPPITLSGALGGRNVRGQVRGGGPLVEVTTGSGQRACDRRVSSCASLRTRRRTSRE